MTRRLKQAAEDLQATKNLLETNLATSTYFKYQLLYKILEQFTDLN